MGPALLQLADDSEVTAALVLTDGFIEYPAAEPPFHILWAVIDEASSDFEPPYGTVVELRL
jgi:hypothetical protein